MGRQVVTVPNRPWHGDRPLELWFPEGWAVERCRIASEGSTPMTAGEVEKAIRNPVGTKPLSKIAEGRKEAVIVFDDMTRPTKIWQYAPAVIDELHRGGIKDDCIRFIIAAGSHGTFTLSHFKEKLGEDLMDTYPVYNHNPFEMLDYVGETSRKTPVWINAEVMACDVKVGIGSLLYHNMFGFSGGGKIINPGVAGIETIKHNHGPVGGFGPGYTRDPSTGHLTGGSNVLRLDAEESARIAGLDFKVDNVLNLDRNPLEVHAGEFVQTHRAAVPGVLKWHRCNQPRDMDVVVVQSYMRQNESDLGLWPASQSVRKGGTVVLIADDPDGYINHWIFHGHGKFTAPRLASNKPRGIQVASKLIIFGPNRDRKMENRYLPEVMTWIKSWDEVVETLKGLHPGNPKVAVLPDGTSGIPTHLIPKDWKP